MPINLKEKLEKLSADPRSKAAADKYKKLETGVWRVLEPVGRASNKIAGRLGAESFWPTELAAGELDKAARILRTFTLEGARADDGAEADSHGGVASNAPSDPNEHRKRQKVVKKIPQRALQGACGIAIFTCFRTGFGFSGAGGSGIVMSRLPDGSWSPPSGLLVHTVGWGFLVGLDIYDVVLIIRRPETLQAFTKPKISVGGELSVAAGPVGNGAVIESGLEGKPVWSYTKSKGAYAGVQLDGTIVLKRDDANARFYGRKVSVAEIFSGAVAPPPAAVPLLQTLYAAEGRPQLMGTDAIPQGSTPGDLPVSEEELRALEANSTLAAQGVGYSGGAGAGASSHAHASDLKHAQNSTFADSASGPASVPPPAYDEGYAAQPPPSAAAAAQPRDAAAEKEALRRQYAQQDLAASQGVSGSGSGSSANVPVNVVNRSSSQSSAKSGSSRRVSASASAPAPAPARVQATFDFAGSEEGDLSFSAGQLITVDAKEGEQWFRGSYTTQDGKLKTGIFPANYVRAA